MKPKQYFGIGLLIVIILGGMLVNAHFTSSKNSDQHKYITREKDRIEKQTALEKAEFLRRIQNSQVYQIAVISAYTAQALWPIWLLLAGIALIYSQKARIEKQVPFEFGEIKSTIPAKKAVTLTEQAIQAKAVESQGKVHAYEAEIAQARVQDAVSFARMIKASTPAPIETTAKIVEELPAFTGPVFLSQCKQDSDYDDTCVCLGRNMETGGLVQIPFEDLQSLIKNGLMGRGKSAATILEIYSALYRKYVLGADIRIHIIDKHHGFDESLCSRLDEMLPGILTLFDCVVSGPEIANDGTLTTFLRDQIEDGKRRQQAGTQENEPLDIIIFDEYSETVVTGNDGREIEALTKELFNYRKGKKYLSLVLYESGKNKNSGKGLNVSKMGISKMMFASDGDEAGRFIGWKWREMSEGLDKGQCLLKLSNIGEVEKIQLALANEVDFFTFAKYIENYTHQTPQEMPGEQQREHEGNTTGVTSEAIKAKRVELGLSQTDFGKLIGLTQKEVSRLEKGKKQLSDEIQQALLAVLFPEKISNVIPFRRSV